MANKNKFKKKSIKEEYGKSGGMGTFSEGTGGGEPMGQGQKYSQGGRGVWKETYDQKPKRESGQPRDASGRFTYNSVNGKGLAPTSDPDRGKTVNPLLKGDMGKDLTYIEDVEKEFREEKGAYWDKFKDKWYRQAGEVVLNDHKIHVAGKAIWNVAKEFDKVKGEFKQEAGLFDETKKGRHTNEEKAALQKSGARARETNVIDNKSKGIKTKFKPIVSPNVPTTSPTTPIQQGPSSVNTNISNPSGGLGGGAGFLKKPQAQAQNNSGLNAQQMSALGNLFGGNNATPSNAPTGPQVTLANFLQRKNKK